MGIRYMNRIITTVGTGAAIHTWKFSSADKMILHTASVYPQSASVPQTVWIAIRGTTGSGEARPIHYENGWATNSFVYSLSRPVSFRGPAQIQLYCASREAQDVEFHLGVEYV